MNKGRETFSFSFNMWKIGNLEINGKVLLAPMAGYTSTGYRKFMKKFGVDICVTEMVSDMGLIYGNKETFTYLEASEDEYPLGVQLFGSDPKNIAKAALICINTMKKISFFDINAGCPVYKVTKGGAGSSLLKNPDTLADIVREIKKVTDIPVTVKIRLGWDHNKINFLEVIHKLEEAGVSAIGIHARTTKELYTGLPHYDLIKDLRLQMKVPLIVSGNIFTLEDAINALDITKADAVMVARGGVGNPFLITQIKHYYETGEKLPNPSLEEQKEYCLELARYLIEEKGEDKGMRIFRSMAPRFFTGYPNSKELRSKLVQTLTTYQDLIKILDEFNI
jgi:tRNA-dihydrouridine synthase B